MLAFDTHAMSVPVVDESGETPAAVGVRVVRVPSRSPNLKAYAERFVRSGRSSSWTHAIALLIGFERPAAVLTVADRKEVVVGAEDQYPV